jgi:WXG100 family type VII secretion target
MKAVANRLSNEAQEIAQLKQQFSNQVDDLHGKGWVGQAADKFYEEMESLIMPSLARLAASLQHASAVSTEIVGIYQTAESEASAGVHAVGG